MVVFFRFFLLGSFLLIFLFIVVRTSFFVCFPVGGWSIDRFFGCFFEPHFFDTLIDYSFDFCILLTLFMQGLLDSHKLLLHLRILDHLILHYAINHSLVALDLELLVFLLGNVIPDFLVHLL